MPIIIIHRRETEYADDATEHSVVINSKKTPLTLYFSRCEFTLFSTYIQHTYLLSITI